MKLSILIPTHNRPKLFQRAINSVLNNRSEIDIEIIVNNDTNDIQEIYDNQTNIMYHYQQFHDISKIYEYLYKQSSGEYIYYLEDDDYIRSNFFPSLDLTKDINYMEYISNPLITCYGPLCSHKKLTINRKYKHNTSKQFFELFDDEEFQLGQILFKKILVTNFPAGNHLNNDYRLFQNITEKNPSFKYISKQTWIQTSDGKDNISIPDLNIDDRFHEK